MVSSFFHELLGVESFRGIRIVDPGAFLEMVTGGEQ